MKWQSRIIVVLFNSRPPIFHFPPKRFQNPVIRTWGEIKFVLKKNMSSHEVIFILISSICNYFWHTFTVSSKICFLSFVTLFHGLWSLQYFPLLASDPMKWVNLMVVFSMGCPYSLNWTLIRSSLVLVQTFGINVGPLTLFRAFPGTAKSKQNLKNIVNQGTIVNQLNKPKGRKKTYIERC